MDTLMMRQRLMMRKRGSGSTLDNYQTAYGKSYNKQGGLQDIPWINAYQPAAILDYFPVQPGDRITYFDGRKSAGSLTPNYLCEYYEDKTFYDWYGVQANPRTVTIDSNVYFIRLAIIYGETDPAGVLIGEGYEEDAYIRNDTTGIYYYKGKNVQ